MKFCEIKNSVGLYLINETKPCEEYLLVFDSKRGYNEFVKIFTRTEDGNRRIIANVDWFKEMNDSDINFTRTNVNIDVVYTILTQVTKYEVTNYSFVPELQLPNMEGLDS